MPIKSENIPFYVLVASAFARIISYVFQLNELETLFNTAFGLIALIFLVKIYSNLTTKSSILVILVSAFLFAGFYLLVFRMNVFGSSIISVVLFSMFYLLYFQHVHRNGHQIKKTLNRIYAIHLWAIFLELVFIYTGNDALLEAVMHGKYRQVTNQLLVLIQGFNYRSPLSLFVMPQAAGHITALGILLLLFGMEWKGLKKIVIASFLVVMFMLSLNTTSLVILSVILIAGFVAINYQKKLMLFMIFAIASGFIYFNFALVRMLLLYKFYADEALSTVVTDMYVENFMSSLDIFFDADLLEKLMGHGKHISELKSGDNNLFNILLGQGMIGLAFFIIFIIYVLSVAMSSFIKGGNGSLIMSPEIIENRRFILINALMVVAWTISIVHYPVATVTAGIHLFAYSAAATLFYAIEHKRILSSKARDYPKRALSINPLCP